MDRRCNCCLFERIAASAAKQGRVVTQRVEGPIEGLAENWPGSVHVFMHSPTEALDPRRALRCVVHGAAGDLCVLMARGSTGCRLVATPELDATRVNLNLRLLVLAVLVLSTTVLTQTDRIIRLSARVESLEQEAVTVRHLELFVGAASQSCR